MSTLEVFSIEFNETEYVEFLRLLISESEHLQNGNDLTARETLVANHVINRLQPYIDSGMVKCNKVEYISDRANLILEYGNGDKQLHLQEVILMLFLHQENNGNMTLFL